MTYIIDSYVDFTKKNHWTPKRPEYRDKIRLSEVSLFIEAPFSRNQARNKKDI